MSPKAPCRDLQAPVSVSPQGVVADLPPEGAVQYTTEQGLPMRWLTTFGLPAFRFLRLVVEAVSLDGSTAFLVLVGYPPDMLWPATRQTARPLNEHGYD